MALGQQRQLPLQRVCGHISENKNGSIWIVLDPAKIEYNPGKRYVAKLYLNSFWGKFAKKSEVTQSDMIKDTKEFFRLLSSDTEKIHDVVFLNDEMVEICHATEGHFLQTLCTANTIIAAFTTATTRLRLLESLKVVGQRALYMDTDPIIYIAKEGYAYLTEGCSLGQLENEFKNDNEYITEFLAAGAKNYGYKTNMLVHQN